MSFAERMKMGDVVQVGLGCKHGVQTGLPCDQCKAEKDEAPPHQEQGDQKNGEDDG